MIALIGAEWLKVRTTRLLLATVPAAVGLSVAAVAGMVLSSHASDLETGEGIRRVLAAAGAGAIVVLVVGIVIAAGEHRHRTAADTYLTTPDRGRVLTAKLAIAGALGAAIGAATAAACVATAALVYRSESATLPLGADVVLAVPTTTAYAALFATLGVAVGTLIRNQVTAVVAALGWIAVVEHTLVSLAPAVGRWLPVGAGQAIVRTPLDELLAPAAGVAVLASYAAATSMVAARAERARDV